MLDVFVSISYRPWIHVIEKSDDLSNLGYFTICCFEVIEVY